MTLRGNSISTEAIPLWQRRWAGPAAVAATFAALLAWTWQRWTDVLVDFGVQLYVPWQIAEGKVLYRDIAHYTGPLSVYYNAMAFRVFGVNLRVLELANLPILIGIVMAIYHLALRLGGRFCAVVCGVSFLILFGFAHISVAGNYNFVTPYEYEYTHATLLCLCGVIFLHRVILRRKVGDAAIAGFLTGMIFLTRAEFFAATMGAAIVGFAMIAIDPRRSLVALMAVFVVAAALPPIVSIGLLRAAMPWNMAIHGTLGMWPALFRGNVSGQLFYRHSMGLDDPWKNLRLLLAWSAAWCIPIAGFAAWAKLPRSKRATPIFIIAFLLGASLLGWNWRDIDWISMFRPLPLLVAAVIAVSLIQYCRKRGRSMVDPCPPPDYMGRGKLGIPSLAMMLGVLSLILLGKVFLYARIIHYGCWLAMPATMLLIIALFGWIPAGIGRSRGSPAVFLAGIGGVWSVVLMVHLAFSATAMNKLDVSVGSGADEFWADSMRGNVVNGAILAAEQIPPDKTVACFPEGIMINYLARRRTSTAYVNFNPPDLLLFGEDRMLGALANSPPDFVLLVHKDTSEFGGRFFGRDYGRKLFAWIESHYQEEVIPELNLGSEPLRDGRFGIRLMVPRPAGEGQQRLIYGPGGRRISPAAASISSRE